MIVFGYFDKNYLPDKRNRSEHTRYIVCPESFFLNDFYYNILGSFLSVILSYINTPVQILLVHILGLISGAFQFISFQSLQIMKTY